MPASIQLRRRRSSTLAALSCAIASLSLLTGACERVAPTEPPRSASDIPLMNEVSPPQPVAFSASMEIPVPSHSLENNGAVDWYATGQTVPAPTWVLLRSYGGVAMTYVRSIITYPCGPDCPVIYNEDPRPDETFTGDGNGSGTLRVNARVRMVNGQIRTPLRGPDRDGQVQWLVYMEPGDQVELMRTGLPGFRVCMVMPICGEPHPPAPMYTFAPAGGSGVAASAVIPLAAVPDRRSFSPGEPVTFTAFVLEEAKEIDWYFSTGGSAGRVRECRGSTTCTIAPRGNGRMVIYAQWGLHTLSGYSDSVRIDQSSRLTVACTPTSPVRGTPVTCSPTVTPARPFVVVRRSARARNLSIDEVRSDSSSGAVVVWRGDAVLDTRVSFVVEVEENGRKRRMGANAQFEITARGWSPLQLTQPPDVWKILYRMTPFPLQDSILGGFALSDIDSTAINVAQVVGGPNAGVWYMRDNPRLEEPGSNVVLHPALYPPPAGGSWGRPEYQQWYNDQNRRGSGTCDTTVVARLAAEVERHEGVTMAANSHYGVANRVLASDKLHERMERLVTVGGSGDQLRSAAMQEWRAFRRDRIEPEQAAFDSVDYPKVLAALGCTVDYNPRDN